MDQRIGFCTAADGTHIAYSIAGNGPPFVKTANYLSHLEADWHSPVFRHFLQAFSKHHTLIRYDERGTGLSDWHAADLSFDSWVSDLETVVDAVGLQKFALFGQSQGGPVAVAYTVRNPERVSRLILLGTYARGWLHRDLNEEQREEEETLISLMRVGWGRENPAFRQFFTAQLIPDATRDQMQSFDELMRVSADPKVAAKLEREMHLTDVRNLAPKVSVPTLVMHARHDAAVPFEEGRRLAGLIPGAQFIPLDSRNHILTVSEPAWQRFLNELYGFLEIESEPGLTPHTASPETRRALAAVLFTDIVASTELIAQKGDREWLKILHEHNALIRKELARFNGKEAETTGDGFIATFESLTGAIQCARAIIKGIEELGIAVRCGLHSGEVEFTEEGIEGIGVHTTARVVAMADPNEILVTSTVRDLVAGSGIQFEDRGLFSLKGIPGERTLLRVVPTD
jgi:pimeloyl-ACP methyl ester carboxylesterase/class 3 adenylate cyclase